MIRAAAFGAAFCLGLCFRRGASAGFELLFRAQIILLTSSLAFVTGWTYRWGWDQAVGLAVLLAGELGALAAGALLLERRSAGPLAVVSSTSNSGFWSIPVAGALAGAPGAAFAVLYDTVTVARGFLVVRLLRKHAPRRPAARSAAVDYLPQTALVVGLLVRGAVAPPDIGAWLPRLGVVVGAVGFGLLGMAMPHHRPQPQDWAAAVPGLALRFGVPFTACLLAAGAGLPLPDAVWVIALAPTPFVVVSLARLYGYRRERAAALPLVSVPIAMALLPVVRLLVR